MTTPELHPWLSTPEAYASAQKAVSIPMALMAGRAIIVGADELLSEALTILTECALPPRELGPSLCAECGGPLAGVRTGAKFCTKKCRTNYAVGVTRGKAKTIPPRTGAHIGSMWGWPEGERSRYAIREVGYLLNNYLRTCRQGSETPVGEFYDSDYNSGWFVDYPEAEDSPREIIEAYLESRGVMTDGTESLEDLGEAALYARKANRL